MSQRPFLIRPVSNGWIAEPRLAQGESITDADVHVFETLDALAQWFKNNEHVKVRATGAAPVLPVGHGRFAKLSDDYDRVLPDSADTWQQVSDRETGLIWMADALDERMSWSAASKAAAAQRLGGHSDWRLPTIKELLSIVDYDRHDPAINTNFFRMPGGSRWCWSSTPGASAPSYFAWGVSFDVGGSDYGGQGGTALVRPVRSASPARQ
jgi:hypothetical protein